MRTKSLLLLFLLSCGILSAQPVQDTIRYLVISEVRMDDARRSYVEVANVGEDTINLGDFEIGKIEPWSTPLDDDYTPANNYWMMFPEKKLAPGETFLFAMVYDWGPEMFLLAPEDYDPFLTKKEFWTIADVKLHYPESSTNAANDSITPTYRMLEFWGGRECIYLRQHFYNDTDTGRFHVDSVLIDQVNGIWRGEDGTRMGDGTYPPVDVAGFTNATQTATLIRKFSVKEGNMDFETGRGQDAQESEWMALPHQAGGAWADNVRRLFWTAKNHGDYNLTEESFVPAQDDIIVDWTENTITVPWGVRRDDSIMFRFEKAPGLAWHYDYNSSYTDSAKTSACTDDTLTVYAAGNDLDMRKFAIIVTDPTDDAKLAVPKKAPDNDGFYAGIADPVFTVTDGLEMDTIGTARFGGVPFGTRIDTLVKYLEIPANASWEVEWLDGTERVDLKDGDIFRVIAADNSTKDYYVKVDRYRSSHNAYLNAINWPDMPEELNNTYGFLGDTIPNFTATKYDYIVTVPDIVEDIPALVAHRQDLNSSVEVTRASSLDGTLEGRTIKFKVTAEDDTTIRNYSVQLNREIADSNKEVFAGDPFISQFVWQEQWASGFIEVVNPGNVNLDMSKYMFSWGYVAPSGAITRLAAVGDWNNRYGKYIPGYKWVSQADWSIKPAMVREDVAVNPIVLPGDVFVIGDIRTTGQVPAADREVEILFGEEVIHWWASRQCDVELATGRNPWNEEVPNWNALQQWSGATWYLFRIENDSITAGLKPATDPNDFTLIDVFGHGDNTDFIVGGKNAEQIISFIRKPEITQGNPVLKGSFGTDAASSEWTYTNSAYYSARNVPWPYNILYVTEDLGSHYMKPTTVYRSTVSSPYYKVSPGFAEDESIEGIAENTTVDDLTGRLLKINEGQSFTFMMDTDTLDATDTVANGAVLIVRSANQLNTTTYALAVGEGLGRDAKLTSEVYTVAEEGNTGTVSEIEAGTTLVDVLANVTKPAGAKLTVLDSKGAYIATKAMGYDSLYVDVLVNDDMYFEVISESRLDTITYKLELVSDASSAFVVSSIYEVTPGLITKVPYGTTANAFMANLVPSKGATMQLVDKFGFERIFGDVVSDDILIVTSEDGTVTQSYFVGMLGGTPAVIYVISEVYLVDQVGGVISGDEVNDQTTVTAFLANLVASEGATFELMNSAYQPKTSGNVVDGDILVVTGPDGETTKEYVLDVAVGVNNNVDNNTIIAYPNPGKGLYHLSGVKAGNRITVTNILGAKVLEREAASDNDIINIEKESNGFYFITVAEGNKIVGRYKVVKE